MELIILATIYRSLGTISSISMKQDKGKDSNEAVIEIDFKPEYRIELKSLDSEEEVKSKTYGVGQCISKIDKSLKEINHQDHIIVEKNFIIIIKDKLLELALLSMEKKRLVELEFTLDKCGVSKEVTMLKVR